MNEKILIPASIIIAGVLIAFGLWTGQKNYTENNNNNGTGQNINEIKKDFNIETALTSYQLDPVDKTTDLILGNLDADIFIIEYTDLECPACISYHQHPERKALLDTYKNNNKVSFVLRHLPLKSLHPGAFQKAVAVECVRKFTSSSKAFNYSNDILINNTPTTSLAQSALKYGVSTKDFNQCIANQETKDVIEKDYQSAINSGITATPTIFVQRKSDGKSFTMEEKMWDSKVVSAIVEYFLTK